MEIRLISQCGPAEGQAVAIRGLKFFIGSNSRCQLRPEMAELAGVHALIERRDESVVVRDFGAEGGTTVNDRVIRARETEVFDGDQLRIGPLELVFEITPHGSETPALDAAPAGWPFVIEDSPRPAPAPTRREPIPRSAASIPSPAILSEVLAPAMAVAPADRPAAPLPKPPGTATLQYEEVGNVLVVTLLSPDLFDETTVSPVRHELRSLLDQMLPRQVVIDLKNVTYMSSRAVGVILAHYQAINRDGGILRVCGVDPKVAPVLDQMRLHMVIDTFDNVQEAVETLWE